MSATEKRTVRRHKKRTDDGKGLRRMIAGLRFRLPHGVGDREADQRFSRIEDLWKDNEAFCRRIGREVEWTDIALWAAEYLKRGELRIPIPPIDEILPSYAQRDWPINLKQIIDRYTDDTACHYPPTVDGLERDEAQHFYDIVSDSFPSVNWLLPAAHGREIIQSHESAARWSLERLAKAKNQAPPDPSTPLITGTFHDALEVYEEKRRVDFTLPDGTFDGSGHHMLGMIKAMRERQADFPLAELDFSRCQTIVDFWRNRPMSPKTKSPLTSKTCGNYIGELKRFFDWLHLTKDFGWRKPNDYGDLDTRIRKLPSDRPSITSMEISTYSIDELALLYKHAQRFERFLLVWCLNCAHGAAEFGRVEWEDILLRKEHPWVSQGLRIETTDDDSWCGLVRPKSNVIGWWRLWPETVQLLEWWHGECERNLRRHPAPNDRVLLTKEGTPLYRDESRNAQTSFANTWKRLTDRVHEREGDQSVRSLPLGTLRDQLPDWLGGDHARPVIASIAVAHGIPHKGDKLLYKHYSNRPWAALFRAQEDYRQYLQPMFETLPNVLDEHDPLWYTRRRTLSCLPRIVFLGTSFYCIPLFLA
ncbi:MAG: hypothetical protein ACYC6Y_03865 [Thermoguttaceae bacterium]